MTSFSGPLPCSCLLLLGAPAHCCDCQLYKLQPLSVMRCAGLRQAQQLPTATLRAGLGAPLLHRRQLQHCWLLNRCHSCLCSAE